MNYLWFTIASVDITCFYRYICLICKSYSKLKEHFRGYDPRTGRYRSSRRSQFHFPTLSSTVPSPPSTPSAGDSSNVPRTGLFYPTPSTSDVRVNYPSTGLSFPSDVSGNVPTIQDTEEQLTERILLHIYFTYKYYLNQTREADLKQALITMTNMYHSVQDSDDSYAVYEKLLSRHRTDRVNKKRSDVDLG